MSPLCAKCREFVPPEFSTLVENSKDSENDYLCHWCKIDKDYITVTPEGKPAYRYTRNECVKDWKIFMKKLIEKRNVKNILNKVKQKEKKR